MRTYYEIPDCHRQQTCWLLCRLPSQASLFSALGAASAASLSSSSPMEYACVFATETRSLEPPREALEVGGSSAVGLRR